MRRSSQWPSKHEALRTLDPASACEVASFKGMPLHLTSKKKPNTYRFSTLLEPVCELRWQELRGLNSIKPQGFKEILTPQLSCPVGLRRKWECGKKSAEMLANSRRPNGGWRSDSSSRESRAQCVIKLTSRLQLSLPLLKGPRGATGGGQM